MLARKKKWVLNFLKLQMKITNAFRPIIGHFISDYILFSDGIC